MIDALTACRIAVGDSDMRVFALRDTGDSWIVDVCGPRGETLDIGGPPLVNKMTGDITILFPPRDGWRLQQSQECKVPEEYRPA